jgi:hypothetical protein
MELPGIKVAGARNVLLSAYPLLCDKPTFPILTPPIPKTGIPAVLAREFEHVILDSGIYTFMFGAEAGMYSTSDIINWTDRLIDFITQYVPPSVSCVEVDCQKLCGPELAWELRKKMRDKLPRHTIINVIHLEDMPRLGELVDFAPYIAIAVQELRKFKFDPVESVQKLVHFIKNRRPELPIHLLGCASGKVLHPVRNQICSADATTWMAPLRGGISHALSEIPINHADRMRRVYEEVFESPPPPGYPSPRYCVGSILIWKALRKIYQFGGY